MTDRPDTATRLIQERDGAVLILTLDGPATRNSIGPDIYDPLRAAMIDAGADPSLRAVVLTGAGGFFCSGGNIQGLRDSAAGTRAEAAARTDGLNAMIRAIHDCPVPVVAAIEGGAAGAGASMALACDMIVAAEGARMTLAYVKIGLTPDGGATWFLRAALPRQMVMEMCVLGRPMPVERLAQAGVVNLLTAPGAARGAALELARSIADGPAEAIATIKSEIDAAPRNDLARHLNLEADGINRARFGAEAAEGLAAFLEKRAPDFSHTG